MTKLDLGQNYHHEFWTIGLNVHGDDCRLPDSARVADVLSAGRHGALRVEPRPQRPKFTTIGQWYWSGSVEVNGEFPDLSKSTPLHRISICRPRARGDLGTGDEPQRG
jgi:hypothetical protein